MVQIQTEIREKVERLLKELFQFECQELDFGIYRIMNFKRAEINHFIEEEIIINAENEFDEFAKAERRELEEHVEKLKNEILRDFGTGTIDEQGKVQKNKEAPKIKEYIEKVEELRFAEASDQQINDVFNHIYEFFSRYYDKGDFISKRRYGGREKYQIPYNGEEVITYWANLDQYYAKSAEYFKNYNFKAGQYSVNFVLNKAEIEVNNNKSQPKFFILCQNQAFAFSEDRSEIKLFFDWRTLSEEEKKNYEQRNIQNAVAKADIGKILTQIESKPRIELERKIGEKTLLETHLSKFIEKNTSDFFIHKNLKEFLQRELDFYIKNEVVNLAELSKMDQSSIRMVTAKIKAIQGIANNVIDFLAQIENFQKSLFEKKKFVFRADYILTIDNIKKYAGAQFLEHIIDQILCNSEQLAEWKEQLGIEIKTRNDLIKRNSLNNSDWKPLPLDTKNFSYEFKTNLLQKISESNNLSDVIDGLLIKSDNFQALSLIAPCYDNKVKCIYIDPPYNTGNDEFIYKDNYQHSSWLCMMADRLLLARALLRDNGIIFVNINDIENSSLMALLRNIFGGDLEIPTFIWKKKGTSTNVAGVQVSSLTDFILAFGGAESLNRRVTPKEEREYPYNDSEGNYRTTIIEKKHAGAYARDTMLFEILGRKPRPGKRWQIGKETAEELERKGRFIIENETVKLKIYDFEDSDTFSANPNLLLNQGSSDSAAKLLANLFGESEVFSNPKPVELIKHLVSISTEKDSVILDYFGGSGTTSQAVMELNKQDNGNRKYILVETSDYFDSLILPRLKKIMFSSTWKDGIPVSETGISHFTKYLYLEQYEDSLNNIVFVEKDKTIQETLYGFKDYFIHYMMDYETRSSPSRLSLTQFKNPFGYKVVGSNKNGDKTQSVDLIETFNYLLGLKVGKMRAQKKDDRSYYTVFGTIKNENVIVVWRNTEDINLESDKKIIEETILLGEQFDRLFINGDNLVKSAIAIEPEFKRLMGA